MQLVKRFGNGLYTFTLRCGMDFEPQAGSEQVGHRPALVLSPLTIIELGLCSSVQLQTIITSRRGIPIWLPETIWQ
jgi:mRNA-degrading endonuclease toxin of MazEF toxin-antitoxin module